MKADSGSWLYILLSVVFLIISAFGKNKKTAASSTPPVNEYEPPAPKERHWPKNIEDVLSEVLDLPKQTQTGTAKANTYPHEVITEKRPFSYEDIEEEAQSLESTESEIVNYETLSEIKKDDRPTYKPIVISKEVKKVEEPEPVINSSDFDLKQGIIYAEILNRKYF